MEFLTLKQLSDKKQQPQYWMRDPVNAEKAKNLKNIKSTLSSILYFHTGIECVCGGIDKDCMVCAIVDDLHEATKK